MSVGTSGKVSPSVSAPGAKRPEDEEKCCRDERRKPQVTPYDHHGPGAVHNI